MGECSTNVIKPKQVWVPKIEGRQRLSGGLIKEKATYDTVEAVEASRAKNDDVKDLDTSRASVLDLTSTTPAFTQKLTCLVFRTTREAITNDSESIITSASTLVCRVISLDTGVIVMEKLLRPC